MLMYYKFVSMYFKDMKQQ